MQNTVDRPVNKTKSFTLILDNLFIRYYYGCGSTLFWLILQLSRLVVL